MPQLPHGIIRRHRLVLQDIVDIAEYIARDSVDAALRFLDSTEATVGGLLDMPGKGALCEFEEAHLAGIRFWAVDGFPNHLIFYRPTTGSTYCPSGTGREICPVICRDVLQ